MGVEPTLDLDDLVHSIASVFEQVQTSIATHKKNCVALYKLHAKANTHVKKTKRGKSSVTENIGEKAFLETILDMVSRVLVLKKGLPVADKVIKFLGTYVQFLGSKSCSGDHVAGMSAMSEADDPIVKFIDCLLEHSLKGFTCRNRWVRYRTVCLLTEVMSNAGEIEEETYLEIRAALVERLQDKEPMVRSSSVIALSKLAECDDPSAESGQALYTALFSSLQFDTAPEVRRSALVHIPLSPTTLPTLLTRTLDVDGVTRKLVYTSILTKFTHPKQLTISQRELILRRGLGDREESIRVTAAKLICSWLEVLQDDLVEFVKLFDFFENVDVTVDAIKCVLSGRSDIMESLEFPGTYWRSLTPEAALLARVFVEHCNSLKEDIKMEAALPVLTEMVFYIQDQYNSLLGLLQKQDFRALGHGNSADESIEDDIANSLFIAQELLRLCLTMDFSDEIGRRKMFMLIREMLGQVVLPDGLIRPSLEILKKLTLTEKDFVRLVVEIVDELRDPTPDQTQAEEEFSSIRQSPRKALGKDRRSRMSPEEKLQADLIDLRSLDMCIAMLENINSSFEENSTLEGILSDLIVPSVERKELVLRERGLVALGLCCLVSRNMALNAFQLFLNQIRSAPERLKVKVVQVVFDILLKWDKEILGSPDGHQVISFLMQILDAEESMDVQALICLGFSKLLLYGLVTDAKILTGLVLAYVSPATSENTSLKQCLAYFLPVYCYASVENQQRMRSIFKTTYDAIIEMHEDDSDEVGDTIDPSLFVQLVLDWTDPEKLSMHTQPDESSLHQSHIHLAVDALRALYDDERTSASRKPLCQVLSNIHLPDNADEHLLNILIILLAHLQEQCPIDDPATSRLFDRARSKIIGHFYSQLESFDEAACFNSDTYRELYDFIGVTRPKTNLFEDLLQDASQKQKRSARVRSKSRSSLQADSEHFEVSEQSDSAEEDQSLATAINEDLVQDSDTNDERLVDITESNVDRPPIASKNRKGKRTFKPTGNEKKGRPKENTGADDDDEVKENNPTPITPTRKRATKRGRSPTKYKSAQSPSQKKVRDKMIPRDQAEDKNGGRGGLRNARALLEESESKDDL